MSLAETEWLKPSEVAAILGWTHIKAKTAIRNRTFGIPAVHTTPTGRRFLTVHRDEVEKYLANQKGSNHGRR